MAAHRMTPARRAALKKAQAASARKRRGKGKGKLARANRKGRNYKRAAIAAGLVVAAAGAYIADDYAYNKSGKYRSGKKRVKYNSRGYPRVSSLGAHKAKKRGAKITPRYTTVKTYSF